MTSLVRCRLISLTAVLAVSLSMNAVAQENSGSAHTDETVQRQKVALIVSPKGSPLWQATNPLRAGIRAAYERVKDKYELVEFTLSEPSAVRDVLNSAADAGAMLAIGPVSKPAVQAVSELSYLPLPVVAINRAHTERIPELMLTLDMSVESEAEQLVKIALENTASEQNAAKSFVIFTTGSDYDDKLARTIERELAKSGVSAERRSISPEQLSYLRQEMRGKSFRGVFFAMSAQQASLLRPYIPPELPVFGTTYTSPLHLQDRMQAKTQANDLVGMVTLELPAETKLPLSSYSGYMKVYDKMSQEERQMFAVGIDAWQVGEQWLKWAKDFSFSESMSGRLTYSGEDGQRVIRQLDKAVVNPSKTGSAEEDLVQFTEDAGDAGL